MFETVGTTFSIGYIVLWCIWIYNSGWRTRCRILWTWYFLGTNFWGHFFGLTKFTIVICSVCFQRFTTNLWFRYSDIWGSSSGTCWRLPKKGSVYLLEIKSHITCWIYLGWVVLIDIDSMWWFRIYGKWCNHFSWLAKYFLDLIYFVIKFFNFTLNNRRKTLIW